MLLGQQKNILGIIVNKIINFFEKKNEIVFKFLHYNDFVPFNKFFYTNFWICLRFVTYFFKSLILANVFSISPFVEKSIFF